MFGQLFSELRAIANEKLSRLKRRAIAFAAAGVLFSFAIVFGLLAAFIALQEEVGPALSALIIFAGLLAAGLGALMMGRERKIGEPARQLQKSATAIRQPGEEATFTSSGWALILTAFAAGLALSRGHFPAGRKPRR
jgi:hypothetical protein